MTKRAEHILSEALKLPPVERAELVESLLSSFEFKGREAIDALWAQEAEDRLDAFDKGEISIIGVEEEVNRSQL